MDHLNQLSDEILAQVKAASNLNSLEDVRVNALGKKGQLSLLMRELGGMEPDERRDFGARLNAVKDQVMTVFEEKKAALEADSLATQLASESIDVTLPTRPERQGTLNPLSHVFDQVIHIFGQMGFVVKEGPDIETDFHNFTALNIPAEHPAREMQDTFYLPPNGEGETMVLRTHTSPVQIRTMLKEKPPIRIIAPGRTYRSDYDQTHTPMFHQVEGLVIDKAVHMGHLKGCLEEFCRVFFEDSSLELRFRPGHFPFTEPSAEVDIKWKNKDKDSWLEILGCGMVHPNVIRNCGLDPDEYQGFAFGMGIERIAMLKYGIQDLRLFFEADLRWLRHYGFRWFERA